MSDQGETAFLPPQPRQPDADSDASAAELVRVLEEYLAGVEKGQAPERAQLLAAHPALAPQLEQCLAGIEFIHRGARTSAGAPRHLGDFELVREIGRGGMGVVYEARQLSLHRKVALKVLRVGGVADKEAVERFQREAETVAQLHHTNIVPIFAIGNENGVAYYAMQFIEGRSLAAILEESQRTRIPLDPEEITRWCMQAAEALVHAHQRGVIHRDMKPANLLLDPDGRIWLTDFGLAKRIDDATLSAIGMLLGTPRYMSPEQASAQKLPVDARTDIYSLGVTLYELATGRPAFDADSTPKLISQILTIEPPAPRRVRASLPRDLETVIVKSMAKEASRRYQDAQALADDLRALAEGRPIKARRASRIERSIRWLRARRRSVLAAAAAAAVAMASVGALAAIAHLYREAHSGLLALATQGGALVAELVDETGAPVVPAFPVPTTEPLKVPEGPYDVRLSAPGMLSETWPVDIRNRAPSWHSVMLRNRWLWPPIPISRAAGAWDEPAIADVDGRPDVIVVSLGALQRIRRLDGATSRPAWPGDFIFDAATCPADIDAGEWAGARGFAGAGGVLGFPALVEPVVDLDGDGSGDCIWASRAIPSLLALSGKTGRLLWCHRARTRPADGADTAGLRLHSAWPGGVLGRPLMLAAGGAPIAIACFVSMGERFASDDGRTVGTGPQEWLEAISGRDGASLWRYPMEKCWLEDWYSLTSGGQGREYHRSCVLAAASVEGRPVVIVVAGRTLLVLDRESGKDVRRPLDVGFRPVWPVHIADFDRDGAEEVLYLHRQPPASSGHEESLGLTVVSPATGRAVWTKRFKPVCGDDTNAIRWGMPPGRAMYACTDLDADGAPEVIVATGAHAWCWSIVENSSYSGTQPFRGDTWAGLEVLDGGTGASRWQRRLLFGREHDIPRLDRFATGPDLDGDGCRELFAVWTAWDSALRKNVLAVRALSGRDGRTLWRARELVPALGIDSDFNRESALCFWQADADGMPFLVVPVNFGSAAPPATYIFSSSTGTLAHTVAGVNDPRAADLDGDGLLDLCFTLADQGTRRLCAIRGGCTEPWKRLGSWKPLQDLDGDGRVDFAGGAGSPDGIVVRSGRDGRMLWRTSRVQGEDFVAPPLPHGDLDKDGICDVFVLARDVRRSSARTIVALSGADGHPLWTAAGLELSSGNMSGSAFWGAYRYPCLDACDLDGDGRAEALVAGYCHGAEQRLCLSVLSGRDGTCMWALPFSDGTVGVGGIVNALNPKDLNGDGVLDAVVWVPGAHGPELRAFSGRDGSALWDAAPEGVEFHGLHGPVQTLGGRDGAVAEVVVFAMSRAAAAGGFQCDVIALDAAAGRRRWTTAFATDNFRILPPLAIDLEGTGRRHVCVGLSETQGASSRSGPQIIVLDEAGTIGARIPVAGVSSDFRETRHMWGVYDLDGDGREELLYGADRILHACGGSSLEDMWTWPLPAESGAILGIAPAGKDHPATLSVRSGDTVYSIAGADGIPRWRVEAPRGLEIAVLPAPAPAEPPRACFGNDGFTVCRQAWPANADGTYGEPPATPRSYDVLPEEQPRESTRT